MMTGSSLFAQAVPDVPLIAPGADLAREITRAVDAAALKVADGDILVIAQKIVSKAEDRYVALDTVTPSQRALALSREADKDPRVVELILSESSEVIRCHHGVLIVEHRLGYVMANAGIDASNVGPFDDGRERVLLLPRDPDATCARLRDEFERHFDCRVGVIINDSVGRAWRNGSVGIALGVSGPPALWSHIGEDDLIGRQLRITEVGFADQIAAAAALLMGEGAEGQPVVMLSGLAWPPVETDGRQLLRARERDLFR